MKNWNGTKQEMNLDHGSYYSELQAKNEKGDVANIIFFINKLDEKGVYRDDSLCNESKSNAELCLDAFDTIQKCGELPSTLLEQRDELLEKLKKSIDEICHLKAEYKDKGHSMKFMNEANELINKIQNGKI